MAIAETLAPTCRPQVPVRPEDIDIPWPLVIDLVVRRLYMDGVRSVSSIGQALCLSYPIVDSAFRQLRHQQLVEVRGMEGDDYNIALTNAGKKFALSRMQISQYVGPCPVSLMEYTKTVRAQSANVRLNRRALDRVFEDLVLTDEIMQHLGPAIVSQTSLFLYGSTGNGKTSIAERLLRIYTDVVVIPYAVFVDGQIIVLYDPIVHRRVEGEFTGFDPRYVVCYRPFVVVGGELTASMLELRFDNAAKIYAAPVQMKANNGIFVVDDFGRQVIEPRKLLNRWIVPLDRRVDFLTLRHGVKFEIPFELMVVFATNLNPQDLADEAFLRRIPNKIYVPTVSAESFDEIFRRVIETKRVHCEPDSSAYLRQLCFQAGCRELRACYPRDMITIACCICEFEERPVYVTQHELMQAVNIYFTRTMDVREDV